MKKLTGIKDHLKKPNQRTPDEQIPTFLDICVDSLCHMRAGGIDAIKNWKLAEKLTTIEEPFEVEDAEFDRIQESVQANPAGYLSWTNGQMMIKAEEWRRQYQ